VRQAQISRSPEALWGGEGLRALAVVPIRHQGAVLGTLNLASYRQDELDLKTRVGIELIASQAAGAIARIRAEESSRRNEAHVRTVVNSAPVALLAVDVSGAITFADGQALAAMGLKPGGLIGRRAMEIYADFPLMLENLRRAHAGEEFSSVLEFASTVFECRFTPVGTRSSASADSASSSLSPARSPLAHRHGIIAVAIDVTERFRLQREILEISDREQARIGQDVHDGLCQQLIGATLKANALEQSLTAQQHQQALVAGKLCRLLDEAITESRRVCRGLYPIRLRTEGLVPALEELAANTSERHPLQCRCEAGAAELHCDVTTATHLYRIAQEALNNAVKHSGASRLSLQLAESEGALLLRVSDDGKGLAPGPRRSSSMGLHIMEYRARLIGGSLRIQSDPSGTTVSCRVPLNLR